MIQIVTKNNVMKNIRNLKIQDQELLNNLLYNTFEVNLIIHNKTEMKIKIVTLLTDIIKTIPITMIDIGITTDTEAIVESIHKIIIDRILNKDIIIDLKVHIKLGLDMIITIKEELHPDLHIDHHTGTTLIIDTILDLDVDLVLNQKETLSDDIITRIDLHPDQEIIDHDLEHLHKTENKIE